MDVNARNFRWSDSLSKLCQIFDKGEIKIGEYVISECEKYDTEIEMME